jgi:hypothetical protein
MSKASDAAPLTLAALFGVLGLIPFFAPLLAPLLPGVPISAARQAQALYAALILSFLGGTRFGRALDAPGAGGVIAASMAPTLLAFAVLLPGSPLGRWPSVALAGGLAAQWIWDQGARSLPRGYRRLRLALSLGACLSLLLGSVLLA